MKIFKSLPCQPYIRTYRIIKQHLKACIHGKLKLFIIWAVHIGFHHTVLQRAYTHFPYFIYPGYRGINLCSDFQGITSLFKRWSIDCHILFHCIHHNTYKTEGSVPERLIAHIGPIQRQLVCQTNNLSILIVIPWDLPVRIPEFFKICNRYLSSFSISKRELEITICDCTGIHQDFSAFSRLDHNFPIQQSADSLSGPGKFLLEAPILLI